MSKKEFKDYRKKWYSIGYLLYISPIHPPHCVYCQGSDNYSFYFLIRNKVVMEVLLLLSCFSRVRLCDPIDGSPPGSPVPEILQARTLEWVAIFFSNARKWKVKVKSLSHVWLLAIPWTAAYQAPPSIGSPRQEYWSGVPLPSLEKHFSRLIILVNKRRIKMWSLISLGLK